MKEVEYSDIFQEDQASYYNPATRKWISGKFILNKNHIQFLSGSAIDNFHLCLPLSTMTGVERRLSNLIYPSIVICIGSEKHWFGSFSNRDSVYNLVELFWKESLLSRNHKLHSPQRSVVSSIDNKEILNILHESENILIGAANDLMDQSRQLEEAREAVEDINSDLNIAQKAVKSLSSPLPLACFLKTRSDIKDAEARMHKYAITYSFTKDDKSDWKKGTLVVTNDSVSLNNSEGVLFSVPLSKVIRFQILSPWDFYIAYSNEAESICYFMCPHLSRILKFVSSIPNFTSVIYNDEDSSAYETASSSTNSSYSSVQVSPCSSSSDVSKNKDTNTCQIQEKVATLTDEEIQELNTILKNLKTLAAEVSKEQENQMEKIDELITEMEKTDERVKSHNKNVK